VKFHTLRPGDRFSYREQTYRKVSPLMASNEADGSQRLIPRSATVTLLDGQAATPRRRPDSLSTAAVEQALDDLVAHCRNALRAIEPALQPAQLLGAETALRSAAANTLDRLLVRAPSPATATENAPSGLAEASQHNARETGDLSS
jgi:hypothetical protein